VTFWTSNPRLSRLRATGQGSGARRWHPFRGIGEKPVNLMAAAGV
jgi:hypothetical protein